MSNFDHGINITHKLLMEFRFITRIKDKVKNFFKKRMKAKFYTYKIAGADRDIMFLSHGDLYKTKNFIFIKHLIEKNWHKVIKIAKEDWPRVSRSSDNLPWKNKNEYLKMIQPYLIMVIEDTQDEDRSFLYIFVYPTDLTDGDPKKYSKYVELSFTGKITEKNKFSNMLKF